MTTPLGFSLCVTAMLLLGACATQEVREDDIATVRGSPELEQRAGNRESVKPYAAPPQDQHAAVPVSQPEDVDRTLAVARAPKSNVIAPAPLAQRSQPQAESGSPRTRQAAPQKPSPTPPEKVARRSKRPAQPTSSQTAVGKPALPSTPPGSRVDVAARGTSKQPPKPAAEEPTRALTGQGAPGEALSTAAPEELDEPQGTEDDKTETGTDNGLLLALRDSAEKPQTIPAPGKPLSVDLESLPLSFGPNWSLDHRPDPVARKSQCILASNVTNIFDGYDRTDIQLHLTADHVYVKTDSNIDLSYPETGIRIDSGAVHRFDMVVKETTAVIATDVAEMYASMQPGRQITVRLGFWPTWPVTETRVIHFSLAGFPRALEALRACDRM